MTVSSSVESVETPVTEGAGEEMGSQRGGCSNDMGLAKPIEEQSSSSTLTTQSAPAGPALTSSCKQIVYEENDSEPESGEIHVLKESKRINKKKIYERVNPSALQAQSSLLVPNGQPATTTTTTTTTTVRIPRATAQRINYGKFTVKTPSNYLRKELKKYQFDFAIYEAKSMNRRSSAIYLNLLLLQLRNLMTKKEFSEFIKGYLRNLDVLIWKRNLLQSSQGWSEKNQKYIEYFERAKVAAVKFEKGNYIGSIKHYFGTGKEAFYLEEGIKLFNQRRILLKHWNSMKDEEEEELFNVLSFDN